MLPVKAWLSKYTYGFSLARVHRKSIRARQNADGRIAGVYTADQAARSVHYTNMLNVRLGVSNNTVLKLLADLGDACAIYQAFADNRRLH